MGGVVDPCRGCVCASCKLSEKQGHTYGCSKKRCKNCEGDDTILKLAYCEELEPVDEGGDYFTL
jgi:hypothetical protein